MENEMKRIFKAVFAISVLPVMSVGLIVLHRLGELLNGAIDNT